MHFSDAVNLTLDDASGFNLSQGQQAGNLPLASNLPHVVELRQRLEKEPVVTAKIPLMRSILEAVAKAVSGGAVRARMADLYAFDEHRKNAQRKRENVAAMALLNQIDAGEVDADKLTKDQKATLAKYSGTGGALIGADGKKGSAYEYYTPAPIAEGIWDALKEMGFGGGKVLDPCGGTGIFGATAPENSVVDAVELNETSGRVNQLVNGGPGYKVAISPFERIAANTPDETYDAVVTNVPFGSLADRGGNQMHDKRYQDEPLQNYFILRSLEKLKPGGIAAFITPPRCVSGKDGKEKSLRVEASFMAEFIGAYRLPNVVFGTAAADTITDVMFFRKHSKQAQAQFEEMREQAPDSLETANVLWREFLDGDYFKGEGRRFVLGELAKVKGQWGEVDAVTTNATVGEIGKMLRKLPDSRIDWQALTLIETSPILYKDGDTLVQAGVTMRMQQGRWVEQESDGDVTASLAEQLARFASPYAAFEARATHTQATELVNAMNRVDRALDIPGWLRAVVSDTAKWPIEGQDTYWSAGIAGLAAMQVIEERGSEESGVNYLDEYAALSQAMQVQSSAATKAPSTVKGRLRLGLKAITTHYNKKAGFSAFWRGDVLKEVGSKLITADGSFDGLRYVLKSQWVPLDKAREVFGQEFDPMASDDWCISVDGQQVCRAADYYSGGYGDFLRRIDAHIATTTDASVKAKLLRQKLMADKRIERVDVKKLTFNLFSPHVTAEEKADFLRRFVDPAAAVVFDEKTGKARADIDLPKGNLTDEQKLKQRLGDYLKNGTITLGGVNLTMDDATALRQLRRMVQKANEQFNGWARGNDAIRQRLEGVANDPDRLRFAVVEDEEPLAIPGLNPDLKLHGYQNSFVRQQAREFGGGNAFDVGLGKTFTALASVQYVQSIGVKKKTFFVMPGSVLSNWRKEASKAYSDTSDCLFVGLRETKAGVKVDPKDYDADLNSIRENRHSKVFMTFEASARLRMKDETTEGSSQHLRTVDATFAEVDDKKQDERNKGKQSGLVALLGGKTNAAPFLEDLGADSIVIDEAHAYKNSSATSDFKGGKYLSLADASDRGLDMQAKAWFIRGSSPAGDGVLALTASPITNSPLEIYSMLSLAVGHQRVNDMCLGTLGADQFMHLMCQVDSESDVTMDGIARETNVFTGLNNVAILRHAVGSVFTIKTAADVGAQVVVPDAVEQKTAVALSDGVKARLGLYKDAFRWAIDTLSEKPSPRGDMNAFDQVAKHFGEPMELIGHPFNLINKMTMLLADPELDQRATFFGYPLAQAKLAQEVVSKFNAKKISEERARPAPFTKDDAVSSTTVKKDLDGTKKTVLKVEVRAYLEEKQRIVIDTIDPDSQAKFEEIADKAGLMLDVTIPPKLAAMLANFQKEQATPRGVDDEGKRSPVVKQIVFCDILPLHSKIKRLIHTRAGVAMSAIAVITGRTNNKPEQILEVQDGFNAHGEANKYRTVVANEKAEVGINLQKGTQAIHHLTIGWTPDSLQQRNGRGVRQGNKTGAVTIYHYDANGTFDTSKRTMVSKKADWIGQVMDATGGNKVEVSGGMSAEQMQALIESVGDADAMERIQRDVEAKEALSRATSNRERQQINLDTIDRQRKYLERYEDPSTAAIDAVLGMNKLLLQKGLLQGKLMNPKATATAMAKNSAFLEEVDARLAGMAKMIDSSLEIRTENETGQVIGVLEFLNKNRLDRTHSRSDEDLEMMLKGKRWPRHKSKILEGSELHQVWRAEVEMAKRLQDEALNSFAEQAKSAGSMPAGMEKRFEQGGGVFIEGRPFVSGTFFRDRTGTLLVFDVAISAAVHMENHQVHHSSVTRFNVPVLELFYPGAAGYVDCLQEAARIEDEAHKKGQFVTAYSDIALGVVDYRATPAEREYEIYGYSLPSPHFPLVITADEANQPGAKVLKRINEEQAKVIKRVSSRGRTFIANLGVNVIHERSDMDVVLPQYAKAHGLVLSQGDLASMSNGTIGAMVRNSVGSGDLADAEFKQALDSAKLETKADGLRVAREMLTKWMPMVDWTWHTQTLAALKWPLGYLDASYRALTLAVANLPD